MRKKFELYARKFPQDHISAHLTRLRELDISRKDPCHFYRKRDFVQAFGVNILNVVPHSLEGGFYYPNVIAGEYTATAISPIRYLMNQIRPDTAAIVEFGSGWSANLFQLYVGLGATVSRKIDYHGAEYTDEGQQTATEMAAYDKNINYYAHSFDYRKPDVSFLNGYGGHILAFTRHSIEQVDEISPLLYDQLGALKAAVTLVHLEPVGWQTFSSLVARRTADDVEFFEAIGARVAAGVVEPQAKTPDPKYKRMVQAENAAWWSWRMNYNTNLFSIISGNRRANKIKMIAQEVDFAAIGNVLNPTTLFHLEFIKEPSTRDGHALEHVSA
ncbi:hypothetical protein [Mesorhizobium sp. IMUNJ 23232]|uniref:hypothetical protein n=1 Tax=Mesorhizobium sp. IMUNJ 23232 TaxID=3376064 RepID=UPI0037919C5D